MEHPYRGTSKYIAPPKKVWPKEAELKKLKSWVSKVERRNRAITQNILFVFLIFLPQVLLISASFFSRPEREIIFATLTIWSTLGILPFFGIMNYWDRQDSHFWRNKKKVEELVREKVKFYEEI